jgi:hypothetical protein
MTLDDALRTLEEAGRIRSRWLRGMSGVDINGLSLVVSNSRTEAEMAGIFGYPFTVDLSDPLTVQGLLLLAREAWGDPTLTTMRERLGWRVYCWPATPRELYEDAGSYSPAEAEAIVAALVAAAEGV